MTTSNYLRKDSARGITRRNVLQASASGGLLLGLSGVSGACSSGNEKQKLRLWTWYGEQRSEWPKLIKEFEEKHPNITVENRLFGDTDSYLPALQASVSSGDPPDIFAPHVLAIEYGESGIALDLKEALGDDFLADFFESTNDEYSSKGKQYAIGWMAQTFGIFYDPRILKKARVDVPETWDDLIEAAPLIRERTGIVPCAMSNNPGTSGLDFMLPLVTQATDDPHLVLDLDLQRGDASWDHPAVVEALGLTKRVVDAKVPQPGINGVTSDQAQSTFYTGKSAMLYQGSWAPQNFVQSAPKEFLENYRVAPTPAWKSGAKNWCANQAGAGLAISAESENVEAATEFLKFLYEPKRYARVMNASNSMPSTKTAAEQVKDPVLKQMTSWLLEGNGCPHILFGKGSSDAAASQLSAVIGGDASPEDAAANIQSAVKKARSR